MVRIRSLCCVGLIALTLPSCSTFSLAPSGKWPIQRAITRPAALKTNPRFHRGPGYSRSLRSAVKMTISETTPTIVEENLFSNQPPRPDPNSPPYALSPQQTAYVWLTSIFVTCLIIADVIGVKLFEIPLPFEVLGHKTVEHTCGMLTFPVTFLLGDLINEYYGKSAAKRTVYIGFGMSIFVFLIMNLAQALPYLDKPFNVTPQSFDMIFGSAKLMYVASLCAYLIGQLSDIAIFDFIKRATKGNLLWLRATGSTVISQLLDSFVVSYIAFSLGKSITGQEAATVPEVLNIAYTGYGLKFFFSLAMTPVIYAVKEVLHNSLGLEGLPPDYKDPSDHDASSSTSPSSNP